MFLQDVAAWKEVHVQKRQPTSSNSKKSGTGSEGGVEGPGRVFRGFWNLPLRVKFLLIALISTLSVSMLSGAGFYLALNRYDALLYRTSAQSLQYIVSNVESGLSAVSKISDYLIASPSFQENLMMMLDSRDAVKISEAKKNVYDIMNQVLFSTPYIQSITVVNGAGMVNIGIQPDLGSETIQYLRREAAERKGVFSWQTGAMVNQKVLCIREVRQKAFLSLRSLGTLILNVDLEKLVDHVMQGTASEGYRFMLLSGDAALTPNRMPDVSQETLLSLYRLSDQPYSVTQVSGRRQFLVRGGMREPPWGYLYLVDYDAVFSSIRFLRLIFMLTLLMFTLLALFFVNRVTGRVFAHFRRLMEKMKRFKSGDLQERGETQDAAMPKDELGEIDRQFNEMAAGLHQLIQDNYVKQLTIKDAQLHMLEDQINPHFMYNTLDAINWMAQKYNAQDISDMAISLGTLLRANLTNTGDFVTLGAELELLGHYIQIQKYRYQARLRYEQRIPDVLHRLQLPKMILQPIVENAVRHGVEPSYEGGLIRVSAEAHEGTTMIQVANTSSTFDDDLLGRLERGEVRPTGSGIGLTNIDKRLRLLYGDDYGLRFSNEKRMAVVTVTIPNNREQKAQYADDA